MKRKYEVSLMGQRFTLRSERDEEYVQNLAKFVAQQIEEIRRKTRTVSTHQVALLVALNLADQLFQQNAKQVENKSLIQQKLDTALHQVDNALSFFPKTLEDLKEKI